MRPESKSNRLLAVTRSKAKMIEYHVPEEYQEIDLSLHPDKLFTLSIGLLGDFAAAINREELAPDFLAEMKTNLLFSARFFDSYFLAELNRNLDPYLIILGSSAYYLCDLPGSASILAHQSQMLREEDDPYSMGHFLRYLLAPDKFTLPENTGNQIDGYFFDRYSAIGREFYGLFITPPSKKFDYFAIRNRINRWAEDIRAMSYRLGGPRQLLFADMISAVIKTKLRNSSWECLPRYTGISLEKWYSIIAKKHFIKEFWPAQHLLGKAGVLKGESAIVQMPTSAGKTKATELILRSAFLAERVSLAIIIAPFRALCHEIKNSLVEAFYNEATKVDELSDALQTDFEIAELLGHQQILVVTPEKLLYVLRHAPELAAHIGLLIFDEGHQFDSGTRGINYELLLTSLRSMIPEGTQKVLISAVISNAEAVGEWLNGKPKVVEGTTLIPTFRSVGFTSWLDQLGRIEYVDSRDPERGEFFVPRVIERFNLGRKKKEKKDRFFPEKTDGQAIALYLGLKLVPNGSIAIFCGRKSTATNICEKAVDIIERGVPLALPSDFSDAQEVKRLTYLHVNNLGTEAPATQSAEHGIFSHHGNTPHGIRLAVEHAMRHNLVRFVVCTSTLAQGVNLPIRYLIVTSVYQGMERIKVRDFHNLIGRAGRAGMHTEGSILFADPVIYDKRKSRYDKWRWDQVKELLDPRNSEPCISNLLSIFDPIKSDDEKYTIRMEALDFAKAYVDDPDEVDKLAAEIATQHGDKKFSRQGVERQIAWKISLICAIESFLLSHWDESEDGLSEPDVTRLAEGTLAFFLADDQKKEHIRELFQLLARKISANITDPARRKIYGRTLYGIQDTQAIEEWVHANADSLLSIGDETDTLDLVWPLLTRHIKSGIFAKFDKPEVLKEITYAWISGKPFSHLLEIIHAQDAKMIWGAHRRGLKVDHVVDVCEGTLAYDGALVMGAVCEFIKTLDQDGARDVIDHLQLFQKRLKYGLPTETTIALYELGFSDRVIAQDIAVSLNLVDIQKNKVKAKLKQNQLEAEKVIDKYPSYFQYVLRELVDE